MGMTAFVLFGAISPLTVVSGIIVLLVFLLFGPLVLGAVLLRERQVGVVVKRFGTRALAPGAFIALNGEAGYQADTLAPGPAFRLLALAIPHFENAGHYSASRGRSLW
jgi:uncharacterized membrane protein YqiK